jgi:hypothetical protein
MWSKRKHLSKAEVSHITDANQTLGSSDHRLLENHTDARHRPWLMRVNRYAFGLLVSNGHLHV